MLKEAGIERPTVDQMIHPQQRRLDFSGAKNFRDLGGYRTCDGRTVRQGVLYRSGGLHKLTDADLKRLFALSLDRVIDFRSDYERELEPDRDAKIRHVEIPIMDASTALIQESRDAFAQKIRGIDPVKYMTESYTGFVKHFTPAFQKFFRELASAEGRPVLFHCTAGKDRTGFAAAVILRLLGVPQETVMEDYLLTNDYFFAGYKWNLMLARLMKGELFISVIKGFMRAEPYYLSAAFDTIEREYGLFENYICDGLGLSATDVERFQLAYLE